MYKYHRCTRVYAASVKINLLLGAGYKIRTKMYEKHAARESSAD